MAILLVSTGAWPYHWRARELGHTIGKNASMAILLVSTRTFTFEELLKMKIQKRAFYPNTASTAINVREHLRKDQIFRAVQKFGGPCICYSFFWTLNVTTFEAFQALGVQCFLKAFGPEFIKDFQGLLDIELKKF